MSELNVQRALKKQSEAVAIVIVVLALTLALVTWNRVKLNNQEHEIHILKAQIATLTHKG